MTDTNPPPSFWRVLWLQVSLGSITDRIISVLTLLLMMVHLSTCKYSDAERQQGIFLLLWTQAIARDSHTRSQWLYLFHKAKRRAEHLKIKHKIPEAGRDTFTA